MRNRDTTGNDVYFYDLVASTEAAVCTEPGDQMGPQLSGNWIVWMDARDVETSSWDIYGFDLASGIERPICTAPGYQAAPRISGDWVVWEDEANISASGQDIYAHNLATGETLPVCTAPGNQHNPRVSGSWVVWLDERNWGMSRWDLYAKNLATGEEQAVCTAPENQWNFDVSGDWVVWTDRRSETSSGYDIYARNLDSEGERAICTARMDQERPRIEGDLVVWTDGRDYSTSGSDIYAYDLVSDAERPLCTAVGSQTSPEISGSWVTWNDGRNADQTTGDWSDIYALDLTSETERAVCTAPRNQWIPVISGNWILWNDGRSGTDPMTENSADWDIYGYDLSAPQAPSEFTLQGKVADKQGNPLLGCTITAKDTLTKEVIASTASLVDGQYGLSLPAGTYDVAVSPPGASSLQAAAVLNYTLSADAVLDVVLAPEGIATLSGHVSDAAGQPLAGWAVYISRASGGQQWVQTNASGAYSIALAPGDITGVAFSGGDDVYIDSVAGQDPLSVQGDTTLDFTLPMHNVTVLVEDAAREPVSGATVRVGTTELTGPFTAGGLSFNGSSVWSRRTTTDAGGSLTAQLLASAAPYTFTITPPVGDTRFAVTTVSGVMVAGEKTLVIALQSTDSAPPSTTASPDDGAWRPGPVEVLFTATDAGSGVAYTEHSLDGGATWQRGTSLSIAAEGATTIRYRSVDVVGNVEAAKIVVVHVANTVAGTNQTVELPSSVALTFDTVTVPGLTSVTESAADPGPEPAPFQVAEQNFFQIETTAVVEGPITVALPYDPTGLTLEQQKALKLMHLDGGEWIDVTTWVDTTAHLVYGSVTHFSWFALAVDTSAPTISVTNPTEGAQYVQGQVVKVDWSAVDEETGIDPFLTYSSPVGSGAAIDTSTLGREDPRGHRHRPGRQCRDEDGPLQRGLRFRRRRPAGEQRRLLRLQAVQHGAAQVRSHRMLAGQPATGLTPRLYLSKLSSGIWGSELEAVSTNQPDAGNLFRETASGTYMFNLSAKGLSTGTWRVRIDLGSGGLIYAQFSLK